MKKKSIIHIGGRSSGKVNKMILSMIPEIEKGNKIAVLGCKNPKDITERLKSYEIDVKSEEMIASQPINIKYIEEEIVGFEIGEKLKTGFIFYK